MPDEPEHERLLVAVVVVLVSTTLFGESVQPSPVDGVIVSDRFTVPVNPFWAETVTPTVVVCPARTVALGVFVTTVKSGCVLADTVTESDTACVRVPDVPVTVTV